jgi:hypothetical protein
MSSLPFDGPRTPGRGARSNQPTSMNERIGLACYFLLGAGLLAPLNSFLSAIDYFSLYYGPHMDRLFTVCYLPMFLKVLLTICHYGSVTDRSARITVGFSGFIIILGSMPLIDLMLSDSPHDHSNHGTALTLTLCLVVISGVLDGLAQSAVFVDAARCGLQYVKACVGGTASSGVIIGLLRIVTKSSSNGDTVAGLRTSTSLYFIISASLAAMGLISHTLVIPRLSVRPASDSTAEGTVPRVRGSDVVDEGTSLLSTADDEMLPVSRPAASEGDEHASPPLNSRKDKHKKNRSSMGRSSLHPAFVLEEEDSLPLNESDVFHDPRLEQVPQHFTGGYLHYEPKRNLEDSPEQISSTDEDQELKVKREVEEDWRETKLHYLRILYVIKKCYMTYVTLIITYAATLSVFPGVIAEDIRFNTPSLANGWYAVLVIFLYNLGDCLGKLLPIKASQWRRRQVLLPVIAVLRAFILVPLIALTARSTSSSSGPLSLMIVLTIVLGITNGYLTSISLTLVPLYASESISVRQLSSQLGAHEIDPASLSPTRQLLQGYPGGTGLFGGSPLFSTASQETVTDGAPTGGPSLPKINIVQMTNEEAAMHAEELAVISIAFGLALGAILSWVWLIVADGAPISDFA